MTKAELREKAEELLELPVDDRRMLLQVLTESTTELPPLTKVEKQLIDDALALYEKDPSSTLTHEEFQTGLDAYLKTT